MKLINYNYGGPQEFNCWIRGKILCTLNEWEQVKKHLRLTSTTRRLYPYSQQLRPKQARTVLERDILRTVPTKRGYLVNIRVTATNEIITHFKPDNSAHYKRQNYMFEIIA